MSVFDNSGTPGFGAGGFLQSIPQMINMFSGISMMQDSAQVAVQGAALNEQLAVEGGNYSAAVYRSYGQAAVNQSAFNIALANYNFQQQNDAVSRQITDVMGKARSTMGSTGLSLASKSYLSIANGYLSQAEKQVVQMRNSEIVKESQLAYEGQMSATRFENQARASVYEGQVQATRAQYEGEVQAWQATESANQSIAKGFSSIGSTLLSG